MVTTAVQMLLQAVPMTPVGLLPPVKVPSTGSSPVVVATGMLVWGCVSAGMLVLALYGRRAPGHGTSPWPVAARAALPAMAVASLALAATAVLEGAPVAAAVLVLAAVLAGGPLVPKWAVAAARGGREASDPDSGSLSASLTVLAANALLSNRRPDALARRFAHLDADVLVVAECTPALREAVSVSLGAPAACGDVGAAPYCTALFVRAGLPVRILPPVAAGDRMLPRVEVDVAGRAVTVLGVHLSAPSLPATVSAWRQELGDLARWLSEHPAEEALVLAGDFNACVWHDEAASVWRHCRDALVAVGRARVPTWGPLASLGLPTWVLAIDHVLWRGPLGVRSARTVRLPASDHRGVLAAFVIAEAA